MHASSHTPLRGAGESTANALTREEAAGVSLAWTARPANRQPWRVALAIGAIALTWWLALWAFGSPLMAIVGCLALLGAVAEGLFPIHCRVTPKGVSSRCAWQWRTMGWESVKSVRTGRDGVHVSPFPSRSRLSRIRGVTLRFEGGNDPAVLAVVRRYWKGEDGVEARTDG